MVRDPSCYFSNLDSNMDVSWYVHMAVSRNPMPDSLCYIPLKRGACYIPLVARCRAAIQDLELEGLSRQARTCYIPLVTGYVACVDPGLVTSLWF